MPIIGINHWKSAHLAAELEYMELEFMRWTRFLLLVVLTVFALTACDSAIDFSEIYTEPYTKPALSQGTTTVCPPSLGTTVPTTTVAWRNKAALNRFLTKINHEGVNSHDPSDGDQPPGTLTDVQYIPVADQSLIGECVPIILAQEQYIVPFYYSCDPITGAERLAVVVYAESIPLMIIFETTLGGIRGLCEKITQQEPFDATILSMTNISYEEGCVYAVNAALLPTEREEMIDIGIDSIDYNSGVFVGLVGSDSAGNTFNILKGAQVGEASKALESSINVYLKIFTRFDLMRIIES